MRLRALIVVLEEVPLLPDGAEMLSRKLNWSLIRIWDRSTFVFSNEGYHKLNFYKKF